jgi:hypothetical protein
LPSQQALPFHQQLTISFGVITINRSSNLSLQSHVLLSIAVPTNPSKSVVIQVSTSARKAYSWECFESHLISITFQLFFFGSTMSMLVAVNRMLHFLSKLRSSPV